MSHKGVDGHAIYVVLRAACGASQTCSNQHICCRTRAFLMWLENTSVWCFYFTDSAVRDVFLVYRAAQSCDRMSVHLSVTLVDCDHIGWNSSKIISRLVSLGRSLSADPNITDLLQGEQQEIWVQSDPLPVDLSVGIANCGWMVTDRATVTMERKPPSLSNGAIADPLWPPLPPKWGSIHMPLRYANGHMSATCDQIHSMFGSRVGFSGSAARVALFLVTPLGRRPAAILDNFEWPYLCNDSFDRRI